MQAVSEINTCIGTVAPTNVWNLFGEQDIITFLLLCSGELT